jgi:hypothetical protein
MRFVPFIVSGSGLALLALGVVMTGLGWWGVRLAVARTCTKTPRPEP